MRKYEILFDNGCIKTVKAKSLKYYSDGSFAFTDPTPAIVCDSDKVTAIWES